MGKKRICLWTPEDMERAIEACRNKTYNLSQCSKRFNIPRQTLRRHVEGKVKRDLSSSKMVGQFQTLPPHLEEELVSQIHNLESRDFGPSITDVRRLAFQIAEQNNIPHKFNQSTKLAGKKWFYHFKERHPNLPIRKCRQSLASQAKGTTNMSSKDIISFILSTPGKVILFGEHSAVYNKTAIAASLNLRTTLQFLETNDGNIRLKFNKLSVDVDIGVDEIKKQTLASVNDFITKKFSGMDDFQRLSMTTFFHLFFNMSPCVVQNCNGFYLEVDTELSVGSGVGSSASFAVALSTAVLLYENHRLGIDSNNIYAKQTEDKEETIVITEYLKDQILEKALLCERIIHGSPSGIDHTTCLLGSMLKFVKHPDRNEITAIPATNLRVLLVDTTIGRSTLKLVSDVRQLKQKHPEIIDNVLCAMDALALSAINKIQQLSVVEELEDRLKMQADLGELMILNHNMLRTLGVSHKSLDHICEIAFKYKLAAKLTGAGGGGYGYILLPDNTNHDVVLTVTQELEYSGYKVVETTLGGAGLVIDYINIKQP